MGIAVEPDDDVISWAKGLKVEPIVKPTRPKSFRGDDSVASVLDDELLKMGYSNAARLSILGDVGRENNWDRGTIFKGHQDPKKPELFNRGIISWNGDRQTKLNNFLKKQGVFGKNDDNELRGMARFLDQELQTDYSHLYPKIKNADSTYDASENLRQYIKYVPDAPYNTYDPEFRTKNNAEWAKRAQKLGLGQFNADDIWANVDKALTNHPSERIDENSIWGEVNKVLGVQPSPTIPISTPLTGGAKALEEYPVVRSYHTTAPVPESPQTLDAQFMAAIMEGNPRYAVFVPKGGKVTIDRYSNMIAVPKDGGKMYVNYKKQGLKPRDVAAFVKNKSVGEILNKVDDVGNDTAGGMALQRVDPQTGTELVTSIVKSPESAAQQDTIDSAEFPHGESAILPADLAALNRAAQVSAEMPQTQPQRQLTLGDRRRNTQQVVTNRRKAQPVTQTAPEAEGAAQNFQGVTIDIPQGKPANVSAKQWYQDAAAQKLTEFGVPQKDAIEFIRSHPILGEDNSNVSPSDLENSLQYATTLNINGDIIERARQYAQGRGEQRTEKMQKLLSADELQNPANLDDIDQQDIEAFLNSPESQGAQETRTKYLSAKRSYLDQNKTALEADLLAKKDSGQYTQQQVDYYLKKETDAREKLQAEIDKSQSDWEKSGVIYDRPFANKSVDQILVDAGASTAREYYQQQEESAKDWKYLAEHPNLAVKEFVSNYLRGAGRFVASTGKGLSTGAELLASATGDKEADATKGLGWQFGEWLEKGMEAGLPNDARLRKFTALNNVPETLGTLTGFIATGAVTGGMGAGLAGAGQMAAGQYEDAKVHGGTPEQRRTAALIGGGTGLLATIPILKFLSPLSQSEQATFLSRFFNSTFKSAAKEVGEQEALTFTKQLMKNLATDVPLATGTMVGIKKLNDLSANLTYDPERKVLTLSPEDMQAALSGAVFGVGGAVFETAAKGLAKESQPEVKLEPTNDKPVGVIDVSKVELEKGSQVSAKRDIIENDEEPINTGIDGRNQRETSGTKPARPALSRDNVGDVSAIPNQDSLGTSKSNISSDNQPKAPERAVETSTEIEKLPRATSQISNSDQVIADSYNQGNRDSNARNDFYNTHEPIRIGNINAVESRFSGADVDFRRMDNGNFFAIKNGDDYAVVPNFDTTVTAAFLAEGGGNTLFDFDANVKVGTQTDRGVSRQVWELPDMKTYSIVKPAKVQIDGDRVALSSKGVIKINEGGRLVDLSKSPAEVAKLQPKQPERAVTAPTPSEAKPIPEVAPVPKTPAGAESAKAIPVTDQIAAPTRRAKTVADHTRHSLWEFVKYQGGIRPNLHEGNAGEMRRVSVKEGGKIGIFNSKAGMNAEQMAMSAWERGYLRDVFPEASDVDGNVFLGELEADMNGNKRYSYDSHVYQQASDFNPEEQAQYQKEAKFSDNTEVSDIMAEIERKGSATNEQSNQLHKLGQQYDIDSESVGAAIRIAAEYRQLRQEGGNVGIKAGVLESRPQATRHDDASFDFGENVKPPEAERSSVFAKNKIITADHVERAREVLKKKGTQFNTGFDPEELQALATIGGAYIEAGSRKFADFSKQMVRDFGEKIEPHLRGLYNQIRSEHGFEDMEAESAESGKSKVGVSISQKAIEKNLTDTFGDTADYDKITIKDQAAKMAEMLKDPERVQNIISGKEKLPDDIRGGSFITAVENEAMAKGDVVTLEALAKSKLTSETSRHAQELRTLAERDPDSVVVKLRAVKQAREDAAQKRLPKNRTVEQAVNGEVEKVQTEIKRNAPKKQEFHKFLDSILCKY